MHKRTFLKTSLFSAAMFFFGLSFSQSHNFEGTISYTMKMAGMDLPPEAEAMMAGNSIKVDIKGNKSRTETNVPMSSVIVISDMKEGSSVSLMDMMGSKYLIRNNRNDSISHKDFAKPEIKLLDGTKEIAGYVCKKAEVIFKNPQSGQNMTSTVFYTNQIGNYNVEDQYRFLEGMPLEYSIELGGMKMTVAAKDVNKHSISDDIFNIPTGYKEVTQEELQKELLNGMMGK